MSESRRRPYLIKQRVFEKGNLWGVIAESNGELMKIDTPTMLTMHINGVNFLVDYPRADKPSVLTVVHKLHKDGMSYYFRAIGDQNKRNNFARVPKTTVKEVESNSSIRTVDYSIISNG